MLYSFSHASHLVEYISCGNLVSQDGFLHDKRKLDNFVFIIVSEGTLHIEQNGQRYDVKKMNPSSCFLISFILAISTAKENYLISGYIFTSQTRIA